MMVICVSGNYGGVLNMSIISVYDSKIVHALHYAIKIKITPAKLNVMKVSMVELKFIAFTGMQNVVTLRNVVEI